MEYNGVLPFDLLNQIRDLIRKGITRIVQRPGYMPIIAPLIIPATHHKNPQFLSESFNQYHIQEGILKEPKIRTKYRHKSGKIRLPDVHDSNVRAGVEGDKLRTSYVRDDPGHLYPLVSSLRD